MWIGVKLNLLHHFYMQHEMPILGLELRRHTKSITNVQFP